MKNTVHQLEKKANGSIVFKLYYLNI